MKGVATANNVNSTAMLMKIWPSLAKVYEERILPSKDEQDSNFVRNSIKDFYFNFSDLS